MAYVTYSWIFLVLVLLWAGNVYITRYFNRVMPWRRFGNVRFFTQLFCGILYALLIATGTYALLKILITEDPPTLEQMVVTNMYGAVIFVPVYSLYFSLHFLRSWRKSELESEKVQKENIRSRLESLKSHLDPHFLFNNLNILSTLIPTDPEKSLQFLHTFSDVYRMLLQTRSEDLIPLSEEVRFIESYRYLLETRFGSTISIEIQLPEDQLSTLIPPLTLQMLLENAIKHNRISEKKPLSIRILGENEEIRVVNSLNPKPTPANEKSGIGLENIRNRYAYFTERKVRVEHSKDEFTVHLPLINRP